MTQEQKDLLRAPLPPEAITPHPTKTYLSSIKAIYVVERLNEVFGIGGWTIKHDIIEKDDKMVVVKGVFTVHDTNIEIEQFGGNDNSDRGDAYKGACTDALTKIGSYLGIGMDVFKGLTDKPKTATTRPKMREVGTTHAYIPSEKSEKTCPDCGKKHEGKYPRCYVCFQNQMEAQGAMPTDEQLKRAGMI